MLPTALALLTSWSPVAMAQQPDEEVIVVGNPFARWDDTRWHLHTQVGLPWSMPLYAANNNELAVSAYDLDLVLHCKLAERVSKRAYEAICAVEDASLEVVADRPRAKWSVRVLTEAIQSLRNLTLRMRVFDDGRVGSVAMEGEPDNNRRVSVMWENIRQMARNSVVSFYSDTPTPLRVGQQWIERNHPLFSLPAFQIYVVSDILPRQNMATQSDGSNTSEGLERLVADDDGGTGGISGPTFDTLTMQTISGDSSTGTAGFNAIGSGGGALPGLAVGPANSTPASSGASTLNSELVSVDGLLVARNYGEGTVVLGDERQLSLKGDLQGVQLFDRTSGFMTERVWRISMSFTSSVGNFGGDAGNYWHLGKLRQLKDGESGNIGVSGFVAPPGQKVEGLVDWPASPIE